MRNRSRGFLFVRVVIQWRLIYISQSGNGVYQYVIVNVVRNAA